MIIHKWIIEMSNIGTLYIQVYGGVVGILERGFLLYLRQGTPFKIYSNF